MEHTTREIGRASDILEVLIRDQAPSHLLSWIEMIEEEIIRQRAVEDGKAAAGWYFNGPTNHDVDKCILKGINEGDPAIMDTLPIPDFSGEGSDSKSWEDVLKDEGLCLGSGMGRDDGRDDLLQVYEEVFRDAAEDEIVLEIVRRLADDEELNWF
jgi:hypothetical protein